MKKLCKKVCDVFHSQVGATFQALISSLVIVLLLVLLLFQIKPKISYIQGDLTLPDETGEPYEIVKTVVSGSATELEFYTKSRTDYTSTCFDINSAQKLVIDLSKLTLNEDEYSEGSCLEICPRSGKEASVKFIGKTYHAFLYNASFSDSGAPNCSSNEILAYFCGNVYLEIADATAKVVNTMTGEEQPVATENNLVLFSRELESKIQEQLDSASTYEEQYKAESANNITHGDIQYQISIKSESKFNVVCASFEKVRSNTVRTYNSISDGCVSVSYTPTPNEYDLKNQEIMLNSKDAALSMVYDIKTGKISLRGYIDEAELSRINLLPNFWNWYFSNVYMAPLTLISAVFVCVPLLMTDERNRNRKTSSQ